MSFGSSSSNREREKTEMRSEQIESTEVLERKTARKDTQGSVKEREMKKE